MAGRHRWTRAEGANETVGACICERCLMERAEAINRYYCSACGRSIVTVNKDSGTTPGLLACRATAGCRGVMSSAWYRVPIGLTPEYEWYRPAGEELEALSPEMRSHVEMGGLDIRKIGERGPSRVPSPVGGLR